MMKTKRLLFTGSREYTDEDYPTVMRAALLTVEEATIHEDRPIQLVIVQGGQRGKEKPGADTLVQEVFNKIEKSLRDRGIFIKLETHRADWSQGKAAGPLRNKKMVDLGIDHCTVLLKRGAENKGTLGCEELAQKAGIKPVRYWS